MRDFVRERFKTNLKKYRLAGKQAGLPYCKSAKKFAEYINVNYNTYIDYERKGNSPPIDTLLIIASALCVSIDKLYDYMPPEIDIAKFLSGLKINFVTVFEKKLIYILSCPKEKEYYPYANQFTTLQVDSDLLADLIGDFKEIEANLSKSMLRFIFLEYVKDYNNKSILTPIDRADRKIEIIEAAKSWRLELNKLEEIKKKNDFKEYFKYLHEMFEKQKKQTGKLNKEDTAIFYYGFKDFRGGKK